MLSFGKPKPTAPAKKSFLSTKAPAASSNGTKTWWKRGKATHDAIEKETQEQQERFESSRRAFRFFLGLEEEAVITFVDGDLDENGLLDALSFKNHAIRIGPNKWENYPCTSDVEPCPICEDGNNHATLVSLFTIFDHRGYTNKEGKQLPWAKRIFMAKKNTFKLLQRIASKHGGLAGATVEAVRTGGETSAAVGSMFEFMKKDDITALKKHFTQKDKDGKVHTVFEPLDYEKEISYRTAEQLRALGFGSGAKPIGSEGKSAKEKFDSEV